MDAEKIITTDGGNSFASGALMGAGLNKGGGNDMLAAMMSQFNSPYAALIFLALVMNGGLGGNNHNAAANAQIQALQTQVADNHNSDLAMQAIQGSTAATNQLAQNLNLGIGQITQAVSTVRDAVTAANGNVQLAAQQMIANNNLQSAAIGRQMCEGFCGVQREILSQGYQNQIGNLQQSGLIQGIASNISQLLNNGFTQLGFQAERDACSTRENSTQNTQRIIDTLNNHWNADLQTENAQLKAQIATLNQTQQLLAAINSGATATKAAS